jgi:hypothetical protein
MSALQRKWEKKMKSKSNYQRLLDQYNNRGQTTASGQIAPQKNALSMIFGAIFIFIYANMLFHGNIRGFIISYLFIGIITAIAVWAQLKYFNKAGVATMKKIYKNYSLFKVAIAWLPAIFLDKVNKWIYA